MQQKERIWQMVRKLYLRYDRMMEKQGFYIVLGVCVMVIALSALYTFYFREEWSAEANVQPIVAAGVQEDQSLKEAQQLVASMGAQKTVVPTEAPYRFVQPVSGVTIREYSITEPQLFEAAKYWRIHPGIDLEAAFGTTVSACASGRVSRVWQDQEKGLCVQIAHEYGYETLYAGLSDASYVRQGDPVVQGQTIGHVGNGVLAEVDAQPHLHFEVWRNGSAVDPVKLFLGTDAG